MSERRHIPLGERGQLRVYEAAQYLGIGESTLRTFTRQGEIRSTGHGKLRRWKVADLNRWIDQQRNDGGPN